MPGLAKVQGKEGGVIARNVQKIAQNLQDSVMLICSDEQLHRFFLLKLRKPPPLVVVMV